MTTKTTQYRLHLDDLLDGDAVRFAAGLAIDDDDPVRTVALGANHLDDHAALHGRLYKSLQFPDHYGHNWDALADVLGDPTWAGEDEGVAITIRATSLVTNPETVDILASIVQDAQTTLQAYDDNFAVRLVITTE